MKKLLWCSAHTPTQEQMTSLQEMGEVTFLKDVKPSLQEKINNCPSDEMELLDLATSLSVFQTRHDYTLVQIGGSPMFLFLCGDAINRKNVLFAHSERVSIDTPQEDGSIVKTSVFKHVKWIQFKF